MAKIKFLKVIISNFLIITIVGIIYITYSPKVQNTAVEKSKKTFIDVDICSNGYENVIDNAIRKFNSRNGDDIQVRLTKFPQDSYEQMVNLQIMSGEVIDVLGLTESMVSTYIDKDWLLDLTPYMNKDYSNDYESWVASYINDKLYSNGKVYALPSSVQTYRLIYNKDLFAMAGLDPNEPPKTLKELKEYSERISSAGTNDRKYGFAITAGDSEAGFKEAMEIPATYSGVSYFNNNSRIYDLSGYKQWLQVFKEMTDNGSMFPGMGDLKEITALRQFANGNIGMIIVSDKWPLSLRDEYATKYNWGVAFPPLKDDAVPEGKLAMEIGICYGIYTKSHNAAAAVKVWMYLNSSEYEGELFQNGVSLPARKDIMNNPQYSPDIKNFDKFFPTGKDVLEDSKPEYTHDLKRLEAFLKAVDGDVEIDNELQNETNRLNYEYSKQINYELLEKYLNN